MFELKTLSRPLRRILAEWISKLIDRLHHFRDQLRFGIVRMISSTVAETIEDQFHRSAHDYPQRLAHHPESDFYDDESDYHGHPGSMPARYVPPDQPPRHWFDIFSKAASIVMQWVRGPWAEPMLASVVTLISLLLIVR